MERKKIYKPSEIAKMVGVTTRTVSGWINAGELPAMRTPGRHLLVRVEDVEKFIERMKQSVIQRS